MRNEYEEQLRDAKERDESLKNLEKDGVQVHGLMKVRYIKQVRCTQILHLHIQEVHGLITEQGEVLTRVDNNVESAKGDVEVGVATIKEVN